MQHFKLTDSKLTWLSESLPPVLVILLVWPYLAITVDQVRYPYESVLGGGDLFAIAFTLLLSHLLEITQHKGGLKKGHDGKVTFGVLSLIALLFILLLVALYFAAKQYAYSHAIPADGKSPISVEFTAFSHTSLIACIVALALIYYGKSCCEKFKK